MVVSKKKPRRKSVRRKSVRRKSVRRKSVRRKSMDKKDFPKIFVINLRRDEDKWKKYEKDSRFIRFSACNGVEMSQQNPYYHKLRIMWNTKDRKKKCTAGILNSHMSIIEKIVENKVDQALVVEDDVNIDFKSLRKIDLKKLPQDSMIYFGGVLHPPNSFKDKTWDYKKTTESFKKGINKINPEKYRIFGGFGYYFPKWELARDMLQIFKEKSKLKPLDTEMTYLQKSGMIKYFYYPAISYLHMDDAEKGVHGKSFIKRDMKYYG